MSSTSGPTAFANMPSNLGITACCREVFWVTNNTQYCVATPTISLVTNATSPSVAACAVEEAQQKSFTSTVDGLRKIARNEGLTTLWRGLSPTLLMAVPANVIYFAGYDWLRYNKKSPFKSWVNETYIPLVAGSSARILSGIAVGPIEMFRTRMQAVNTGKTSTGVFRDTLKDLKEMVSVRGYHSLWTGLTLTLWRDVPFSAIYWWGYEWTRDVLTDTRDKARGRSEFQTRGESAQRRRSQSRDREDHTITLVDSFVAGATSGAFAALITTPFDVGKTRQQVVRQAKAMASSAAAQPLPENLTMPRFLWHIFKHEGTVGLFRGWGPRCLKVAPACAIMISSYEMGKKWASGMNERIGSRSEAT
jgi:solute carrier family 25 protein 39/40